MKHLLFTAVLLWASTARAQNTENIPPYRKFPQYPPGKILLPDSSTWFTKEDLPNNTPVLLMLYNSGCHHCQEETREIITHIKAFEDTRIVMVTSQHFDSMQVHRYRFGLDRFPNITLGYDPGYFLMTFFEVRQFPFVALYDRKKQLITASGGGLPVQKMTAELLK